MRELDQTELREYNGGSITAAAVGCAMLGIGAGVIIGVVLAVGVCYAVRKLCWLNIVRVVSLIWDSSYFK